MEHILVQVSKNLQFWKLPKTKKLKPPMVTIFHLNHPNLFFLNQCIQKPVSESKFFFQSFACLLAHLCELVLLLDWDSFGQMLVKG